MYQSPSKVNCKHPSIDSMASVYTSALEIGPNYTTERIVSRPQDTGFHVP